MRKLLHGVLSSDTLSTIDEHAWSRNKIMTNTKWASTSTNLLALTGKACLSRAILELERRFFGNKEDENREEAEKSARL